MTPRKTEEKVNLNDGDIRGIARRRWNKSKGPWVMAWIFLLFGTLALIAAPVLTVESSTDPKTYHLPSGWSLRADNSSNIQYWYRPYEARGFTWGPSIPNNTVYRPEVKITYGRGSVTLDGIKLEQDTATQRGYGGVAKAALATGGVLTIPVLALLVIGIAHQRRYVLGFEKNWRATGQVPAEE